MSALPKLSTYTYATPFKYYPSRQKSLRRKTKQSKSPLHRCKSGATPLGKPEHWVAHQEKTVPAVTGVPQSENRDSERTSQISEFPPVQPLPAKLKVLLLLQKSSLGLAFVLIVSSIAVYICTVRIPELWSKKYQDLETLQRQERELVATNESLKHELAQQAQQEDSNLVLIGSKNTLFIPPVSLSASKSNHSQQNLRQINLNKIPMGY